MPIPIANVRAVDRRRPSGRAVAWLAIVVAIGAGAPRAQDQAPARGVENGALGRLRPPYSVEVAGPFDADAWPSQPVSILKDGLEMGGVAIRQSRFDFQRLPMFVALNSYRPIRTLAVYEGTGDQKRDVAIFEGYRNVTEGLPFVERAARADAFELVGVGRDGQEVPVRVSRDDRSGIYVLYDGTLGGLPRVIFGQSVDPRAARLETRLELVRPNGSTQATGMTFARTSSDPNRDRYEVTITSAPRNDGPTATQMAVTAVFLSHLLRVSTGPR